MSPLGEYVPTVSGDNPAYRAGRLAIDVDGEVLTRIACALEAIAATLQGLTSEAGGLLDVRVFDGKDL